MGGTLPYRSALMQAVGTKPRGSEKAPVGLFALPSSAIPHPRCFATTPPQRTTNAMH